MAAPVTLAGGCRSCLQGPSRLLLSNLLAQLARLFDRLAGTEILQLEDLANLDLALPVRVVGIARDALGPRNRLLFRLHLDQPVAGDHLLGLGEGPVNHAAL